MKTHFAFVALSLALGSAACGATSYKWARDVVVGFAPGSAALDSGGADELRKLMEAAGESCRTYGIDVIVVAEVMGEVPAEARTQPTLRTSEVSRILQNLGAPANRIYEGVSSIAKAGPKARPDTVDIELVCTSSR